MRTKIVAGNWKMNCGLSETKELLNELKDLYASKYDAVKLIVAPTFPNLYFAFESLKDTPIAVAAQNMHQEKSGAFTGEVSGHMLKSVGVGSVILGHSERRNYFKESHQLLAQKVDAALDCNFEIMFCLGEQLEDREQENHFEVVKQQLADSLFHLKPEAWGQIIIAYEPVWAIGTGKTASANQAQEMHAFIRKTIADQYGQAVAEKVAILYGGSVKPHNAAEIFAKADVDGGLIGGASLKAKDFLDIAAAF